MKTTLTKTFVGLTLLLTTASINAQAPFGGPSGEVQQPPTADEILSEFSSNDIDVEPNADIEGGPGGGECDFSIVRTGNDMQYFDHSGGISIAKVSVWDGCEPSFHFSIYSSPYSTSPSRTAKVNLRGIVGGVYDPDVILTQDIFGEISILIVYQYDNNKIAFEQWDYDYNLNRLTLNTPAANTAPYVYVIGEGVNPNIAGNMYNQIAIVYQKEDADPTRKYIVSQVNSFGSPTTFNQEINISDVIDPDNDFVTPDVSISDPNTGSALISYVMIDNTNNDQLYLRQEPFSSMLNYPSLPPLTDDYWPILNGERTANPRVASPRLAHQATYNDECVITAEHNFIGDIEGMLVSFNSIRFYHFANGSNSFKDLNIGDLMDPFYSTLVPSQPNTYPAITYCGEDKVSVAWTYLNNGAGSAKQDVISVNYDFDANVRTPLHEEYFMLVNASRTDNQHAASVSNLFDDVDELPVYYTFAHENYKQTVIAKTSNTYTQPFIRKKSIASEEKQAQNEILIYPNPSNGQINLDFGDLDIESNVIVKLYSLDGKVVFEKYGSKNTFDMPMNINSLTKGVYLMEYQYGQVIERKKILLQ